MIRYLTIVCTVLAGWATLGLAPAALAEATPSGRELFQQRCAACHDERGFGTRVLSRRVPEGQAELEKREGLVAPYIIAVVRRGIGSMPQIRQAELSDEGLALIAEYLEGTDHED